MGDSAKVRLPNGKSRWLDPLLLVMFIAWHFCGRMLLATYPPTSECYLHPATCRPRVLYYAERQKMDFVQPSTNAPDSLMKGRCVVRQLKMVRLRTLPRGRMSHADRPPITNRDPPFFNVFPLLPINLRVSRAKYFHHFLVLFHCCYWHNNTWIND